jgi:hypothetical protein
MPLTYDERLELLKKAREAKKVKREAKLAPTPEPEPETEPEPIPAPVKVSKPKTIKIKKADPPKYIKDDAKMTKEEYLINDPEPEPEPEPVKTKKVAKPRKVKDPVKTLDLIVEPKPIEQVMEEVVNNDNKYKNPNLQSKLPKLTHKPPEVVITKTKQPTYILFDY